MESNYKIVRKIILKKKKKRNIKYLFDIVKLIKSKSIKGLFKYLDNNNNNKKDLYEKILSILIKCYSSDLLNMNINDNLEDYFKNNSKMKNNILVFISSKYNNNNININNITDDKIQEKILKINKYKKFYKNYNILLFVKNKNKILEVIKNSKDTNYDITDIIDNILDYNDFKKYYSKLQNELLNIDLNITGEFNKKFNNTNLIKKFERITI